VQSDKIQRYYLTSIAYANPPDLSYIPRAKARGFRAALIKLSQFEESLVTEQLYFPIARRQSITWFIKTKIMATALKQLAIYPMN